MKISDKLKTVKLSDITPYPQNNKKHSPEQIEKLKYLIKTFQYTQPMGVDENNVLVIGHGRHLALKDMVEPDHETEVLDLSYLSPEQKKEYRILDNKVVSNEWDEDNLKKELEELYGHLDKINTESIIDMAFTGDVDLDQFKISDMDETDGDDEIPDKIIPVTKQGDIWTLGNHTVMCGDSTNEDDVNRLMDGQKADMVFTDPPYGMFLDTDYSKIKGSEKSIGKKQGTEGRKYDSVKGDGEDFVPELITTITNTFKYCKEIFIFGADYFMDLLPNYGKDGCLLVWNKRSSDDQQKAIGNTFELFWSKAKHKKYVFNFEWFGFLSKDAPLEARNRIHPTMKPIGLIQRIFLWYKLPTGIVVDLYLGSGSTLIACEKTSRQCKGMELDTHYCDVIRDRYISYCLKNNTQPSVQLNGSDWQNMNQ